jgi:2-polyprenyl-3-methyl-5-hydroxy-6-metoxy-1,4-benzoquinol methylase
MIMASERTAELPSWQPTFRFQPKSEYVLPELLRFDDMEFIDVAYRALLHREPDTPGRDNYLDALRGGSASKVEILGSIRFSAEGRKCGIHVDGLLLPYKLHQWRRRRLVGAVLGSLMAVARLPRLALHLQSIEAKAAQESQQLGIAVNRLARAVEQKLLDVQDSASSETERIVSQSFAAFERSLGADGDILPERNYADLSEPTRESVSPVGRATPGVDPGAFASSARNALNMPANAEAVSHGNGAGASDVVAHVQRAANSIQRGTNARVRAIEGAARERLLQVQARFNAQLQTLNEQLADLTHRVGETASETSDHITAIKQVLSTKADEANVTTVLAAVEELKPALRRHVETASRALETLAGNVLATRRELMHLQLRLERATKGQSARTRAAPSSTVEPDQTDSRVLDSLYVALEEQFRGSRELISERCQAYLPHVRSVLERAGGGMVLDIGCGRGEWLGVLREAGIEARGIDLNELQILDCKAAGLDVREAEAISYMRDLTDASLAVVTGMHIVEHIPFPSLVTLFDEVFRVLKPGGAAIFETPNPENHDVGACTFYMDPTHLHPLPPALLEFVVRARGFEDVEIRWMTEHRPTLVPPAIPDPDHPNSEAIQWLLDRTWERLGAAFDYAVIGRKG